MQVPDQRRTSGLSSNLGFGQATYRTLSNEVSLLLRELLTAFHVRNLFLIEIGACSISALSFRDQLVALTS